MITITECQVQHLKDVRTKKKHLSMRTQIDENSNVPETSIECLLQSKNLIEVYFHLCLG